MRTTVTFLTTLLAYTTIVLILYVCFYMYGNNGVISSGFFPQDSDYVLLVKPMLLAVFTVMGVISRVVFNRLEKSKQQKIKIMAVLRSALASPQLWMAVIVSPLIMGMYYKYMVEIESYVFIAMMSYQNGFFFQTVFESIKANNNEKDSTD
jgi:hypothetical protein